jgi:hypothetical protein
VSPLFAGPESGCFRRPNHQCTVGGPPCGGIIPICLAAYRPGRSRVGTELVLENL